MYYEEVVLEDLLPNRHSSRMQFANRNHCAHRPLGLGAVPSVAREKHSVGHCIFFGTLFMENYATGPAQLFCGIKSKQTVTTTEVLVHLLTPLQCTECMLSQAVKEALVLTAMSSSF
jgi:hypothetical protein